jgi:dihydroorotate dehydrogenase (fumarate)
MDISTTIAGVRFPSCFMNASGALCVTREELLALGRSRTGAIASRRQSNPSILWISRRVNQLNGLAEYGL